MRNGEHGPSTVYCRPFKSGERIGSAYTVPRYRSVAEGFAAGRSIENWNDGGWFTIDGTRYQVVADSNCIDVIEQRLPNFETPTWVKQSELEPELVGGRK